VLPKAPFDKERVRATVLPQWIDRFGEETIAPRASVEPPATEVALDMPAVIAREDFEAISSIRRLLADAHAMADVGIEWSAVQHLLRRLHDALQSVYESTRPPLKQLVDDVGALLAHDEMPHNFDTAWAAAREHILARVLCEPEPSSFNFMTSRHHSSRPSAADPAFTLSF